MLAGGIKSSEMLIYSSLKPSSKSNDTDAQLLDCRDNKDSQVFGLKAFTDANSNVTDIIAWDVINPLPDKPL